MKMDLDSLNDFGRKIFSEFHDQKEITNADCVFQQTFSFSSKESKWNPVFRLRKSYIEKIHDVKKNAGVGGQLFFFETIGCYHVVSSHKNQKPIHVVCQKNSFDEKNERDDTMLAWFCCDVLKISGQAVERNSYERIDIGMHENELGLKIAMIFAVARIKGKKTHCMFKRLNRHKNIKMAIELVYKKPALLWK